MEDPLLPSDVALTDTFQMMQSSISNAAVTTLSLGSAGGVSVNLKVLDGDVTKQLLETCVTLIGMQARKLEQYEQQFKSFQGSDLGNLQNKVRQHQSMIENLVHNIQGYVDPEDTADKLSPLMSVSTPAPKKKQTRKKSVVKNRR